MSIPRHETPPRFELGSLDSKSSVLTVTLRSLKYRIHQDLNLGPIDLQSIALPLSYESQDSSDPGLNRRPYACKAYVITNYTIRTI